MTTPRINFISPYLRNPYKNIKFSKFGYSLNEVNDDKWECVVVIVDVVAVVCWCCRCCCSQSNRYPPVCFRHTILLKLTNLHLYKSCYIHTYIYTYLSNSYMYMYAHPVLSPNCFVIIIIIILIIIVSQLLLLFLERLLSSERLSGDVLFLVVSLFSDRFAISFLDEIYSLRHIEIK